MKKQFYKLLVAIFLIINGLYAQEVEVFKPEGSNWFASGWGLGLRLSTNGPGIELGKRLTKEDKLFARVYYTKFSTAMNNLEIPFDGNVVKANVEIELGGAAMLLDWHPFKNAFKISAGLGYLQLGVSGGGKLRDSSKIGLIPISPEELGEINASISPKKIAPYVGIGFGRAVPKHRVGFGFEIGTYYIGEPEVSFKTTKLLEPSSSNEAVLKSNMSAYNWLPQISFNLTIKLAK